MIGDLTVKISADISNFVSPVRKAHGEISNVSNQATAATFRLSVMTKTLQAIGAAAGMLSVVSRRS